MCTTLVLDRTGPVIGMPRDRRHCSCGQPKQSACKYPLRRWSLVCKQGVALYHPIPETGLSYSHYDLHLLGRRTIAAVVDIAWAGADSLDEHGVLL